MFNKELFLSLCKKYNVELSSTNEKPMVRKNGELFVLTEDYIRSMFKVNNFKFVRSDSEYKINVQHYNKYQPNSDITMAC